MSQHRSEPRVLASRFARSALRMLTMPVAPQQLERPASELAFGDVDRDAAGAHVRVEPRSEIDQRVGHARSVCVQARHTLRVVALPGVGCALGVCVNGCIEG